MVKRVTISIDKEFAEELKAMASQEGKTLSRFVREALEEWIVAMRRKRTGEALLALIKEGSRINEEEALKTIKTMREEEW